MIHFLVGETEKEKQARREDAFCRACRAAKLAANCDTCSRSVTVRSGGGNDKENGRG